MLNSNGQKGSDGVGRHLLNCRARRSSRLSPTAVAVIAKGTNFGGLPVAVVLLTMHRNERFFNAALDLGVAGYVLKDSAVSEIVSAIHAVSAGNRFVTPLLTDYLLNRRQEQTQSEATKGLTTLTEAERRVMKLIAEYKSSQEIADELFISIRTVDHGNTENAEEAQRI